MASSNQSAASNHSSPSSNSTEFSPRRIVKSSLPDDVLLILRGDLMSRNLSATAASLSTCSKKFHDIFISAINYETIKLHRNNAPSLLKNLCDRDYSRRHFNALRKLSPRHAGRLETFESKKVFLSAKRRLDSIAQCKTLQLQDVESLKLCLEAARAVRSDGQDLFKNVTTLCIGPTLSRQLIVFGDDDNLYDMSRMLTPAHLCVRYPQSKDRTFSPPIQLPNGVRTLPDPIWIIGIERTVRRLVVTWERSLKSLTIHDSMEEDIPNFQICPTRIFFRTFPSAYWDYEVANSLWAGKIWAMSVFGFHLPLEPYRTAVEQVIEFIEPGQDREMCRGNGKEGGLRKVRTLREAVDQCGTTAWEGEAWSFSVKEETDVCRCCGSK